MARPVALLLIMPLFLTFWGEHAEAQSTSARSSAVAAELERFGFQVFDEGRPAPDFGLYDLQGNRGSLSAARGKTVFLHFWAIWCAPCRTEMRSIEQLHARLSRENFVVLSVNREEKAGDVRRFAQQQGLSFPILLDENGRVAKRYGVRGIPATFLIDENGFFLAWLVGPKEWHADEAIRLLGRVIE